MISTLGRCRIPALAWMLAATAACGAEVDDGRAAGGSSTSSASSGGVGAGSGSGAGSQGACATGEKAIAFGASGDDGATVGIAADAEGVYWTNSNGSVWRAEPGGGSPHVIATGLGQTLTMITAGEEAVYVVDHATALWRVPKDGSSPTPLVQGPVISLALGDDGVYFTKGDGVWRVDQGGGEAQQIAQIDAAGSIALDGEDVYVKTAGVTGDPNVRVLSVPKAGGPATLVAEMPQEYAYTSQEVAARDGYVYWLNSSAGTVSRAPSGGGPEEDLLTGIADPMSLLADGASLYVTVRGKDGGSMDDRAVIKVPVGGGAPVFVAHGAMVSAYVLTADKTFVYWTEYVVSGPVHAACK